MNKTKVIVLLGPEKQGKTTALKDLIALLRQGKRFPETALPHQGDPKEDEAVCFDIHGAKVAVVTAGDYVRGDLIKAWEECASIPVDILVTASSIKSSKQPISVLEELFGEKNITILETNALLAQSGLEQDNDALRRDSLYEQLKSYLKQMGIVLP